MKRTISGIAFFFAILISALSAPGAWALGPDAANCNWGNYSKPNTKYLSPQSGTSNQNQINSAIASASSGSSVYLKSGTYIIDGKITLKSNIVLEGDKDAVIQLKDMAGWKTITHSDSGNIMDPLIESSSFQNVEVKCFKIDGNYNFRSSSGGGNYSATFKACTDALEAKYGHTLWRQDLRGCEAQTAGRIHGNNYYTIISANNVNNLSVHDMVLQDGANDGLRIQHASNVKFYNNTVNAMGHEGLYANISHGIEAYGNDVKVRASDGFRGDDCYDYSIHDNVMESYNRYYSSAGIQIASKRSLPVYNIQIFRNVFMNIWNCGIWFSAGSMPKYNGEYPIEVHHNIFMGNGLSTSSAYGALGGIVNSSGATTLVFNNTFYGNMGSGVYDSGGNSRIVSNIFVGTKLGKYSSAGSGLGVQGGGEVSYNVFYQNVKDYTKAGTGNINANPLFYKPGTDFHLQSQAGRWDPALGQWTSDSQSSPAIDAGIPLSSDSVYGEYKNEPENNGDRINAGVYGNTSQASLTGNTRQATMPPAPVADIFSTVDFSSGGGDATGDNTYIPGTGSGGTGPGAFDNMDIIERTEIPNYYDPGMAMTPTDPGLEYAPAAAPAEGILAPLFGELGPSSPNATATCGVSTETGGLVPCGRNTDDPSTPWNECDKCDFCAAVLMGQLTIEFLLKIAGIAATLVIVLSGFLYMFAAGKSDTISKAKSMIKYTLIGFAVVFIAWTVINSLLTIMGYIDPIDGNWYTIC